MIGKKSIKEGTIKAYKTPESNKSWFSMHWAMFGKNQVVNTDEMLTNIAKKLKRGKTQIKEQYDVVYAKYSKRRKRFGDVYYTFLIVPKPEANIIFAFPKKHRKEAKECISTVELPLD